MACHTCDMVCLQCALMWVFKCPDVLNGLLHVTFVWFLSTVNSAVSNKISSLCKSFATNTIFKRFLTKMNLFVSCQDLFATKTLSTFSALVFTAICTHMCVLQRMMQLDNRQN